MWGKARDVVELAQWWADEPEAMRDGGKVLPFKM